MAGILSTVTSLLAAGTLLVSAPLQQAAPQNDITGTLFLVNRQWRVSKDYEPEVTVAQVSGQVRNMRADAAAALEEMFRACKEETGVTLVSVSGYRSYGRQSSIYNRKLKSVNGSKEKADEYVARPGASEHQLALAMDVGQRNDTSLSDSFGKTPGGRWVRENSWRFGFILRYQAGWEDVTGYQYEPWHVRYVGKEYARAIRDADIPFETWLLQYRESVLMQILEYTD